MQTRSINQIPNRRYTPDDVIANTLDGKVYNYEDFQAIHDFCWALIGADLAFDDAVAVLSTFRIIVSKK